MCRENVYDVPLMYQNLTPNWFRDIIYNIYYPYNSHDLKYCCATNVTRYIGKLT